jgi:cytochrome c-type biogenesis protein CcmF
METREMRPVYRILPDRSADFDEAREDDWGLSLAFTGMNVDSGAINLQVAGANMGPEDWLVVQAYEKPFINFVWVGFVILSIGFLISLYRRASDVRFDYLRDARSEAAA